MCSSATSAVDPRHTVCSKHALASRRVVVAADRALNEAQRAAVGGSGRLEGVGAVKESTGGRSGRRRKRGEVEAQGADAHQIGICAGALSGAELVQGPAYITCVSAKAANLDMLWTLLKVRGHASQQGALAA